MATDDFTQEPSLAERARNARSAVEEVNSRVLGLKAGLALLVDNVTGEARLNNEMLQQFGTVMMGVSDDALQRLYEVECALLDILTQDGARHG